jgi:putative ABC transport system permease protein
MAFTPKLPTGVRRLLRLPPSRTRLVREMDEEVRSHLAMRIDELRALGMSEADAEADALRRFGDSDEYRAYAARRAAQRAWWHHMADELDAWMQDIRFAYRQFVRNRGVTTLAVLTLALGIGANVAIFSVVHRLLITPLPYPDGDRIVKLVIQSDTPFDTPTQAIRRAWHDRARSIEMIAAVLIDAIYRQDFGETQDSIPAYVTSSYLTLLGIRPALGRGFTIEEEQPAAPRVAMISYGKWQREYGGRTTVLGSVVRVDDRQYTIVGVTPPEMSVPMIVGAGSTGNLRPPAPAIWLPASLDSLGGDYLFAKLRPGVSAETASAELQAIVERMEGVPRARTGQLHVRAMRAQDFLDPRERQTVEVLFVAVAALLLIACASVANLLMSRAWTRRREFAVRTALGAGRGRLARQVLTESVLLALAGGLLGIGVAWLLLRVIIALRPPTLDHLIGVHLETPVLLWSAGISVVTGILFGCAPALFAGRRPVGDVLRGETRGASGGSAARRMRSTLIVLEIAMSLVLLIGAGLLVRSFAALQRMPLNFQPRGLVSANVILMFRRDWTLEQRIARRMDFMARVRAIPGVSDATIGMMPGQGWRGVGTLAVQSAAGVTVTTIPGSTGMFTTPSFFRIAGMSLVQGRAPDSLDAMVLMRRQEAGVPQEVVVNRSAARRLWPDGRVIGAHLSHLRGPRPSSYVVVGVVEDVQMPGRRLAEPPVEIYSAPPPQLAGQVTLILRTTLPEDAIVASIRRVVAEFSRELQGATRMPLGAVLQYLTVGDRYLSESLAPTRFAMALLAAFSAVALLLSGVGLYGVIAYAVMRRTHEIGVRVALGADARSVRRLVVADGLRLTAIGVTLGLLVAAGSTRALAGLLYGVSRADPVSFAAIVLLIVTIALAACYVPARRATRIHPTEALRAE